MQDLNEPTLDSTEIGLEERASRRDSAAATLLCLAVSTFAIGTEGFMIAGLLPRIAADLAVSLVAAGHLVTVFALAYAVGSPVLTVLTGGTSRQRGLVISLGAFAGANLLASIAPTFAASSSRASCWRVPPGFTFPVRARSARRSWVPRDAGRRSGW